MRTRWYQGISLGLALAVHGLFVYGGLQWQSAQEIATDTVMTTVMVDLDTPPHPPAAPLTPQPGPGRILPSPIPQPAPAPTPPTPPANAAPEHITPIPEHAMESAPTPLPEDSPATANTHLPQADTAPTSPPTIQSVATIPPPQAIMNWQQQLLAHLQRYRGYPRQAKRLRQEGIAHVRFSVNRRGQVSHPRIEHPSGYQLLDKETLATVHRANPVPPPPLEVTGNPVDVVVPVSFHLRKR